jgi:hypothetical protein
MWTYIHNARIRSEKVLGESPTVELLELAGADHMEPLTSSSPHWEKVIARVEEMLKR